MTLESASPSVTFLRDLGTTLMLLVLQQLEITVFHGKICYVNFLIYQGTSTALSKFRPGKEAIS